MIRYDHGKLHLLTEGELDELFKKSLAFSSRMKQLITNIKNESLEYDVHIVRAFTFSRSVVGWGYVEIDDFEDSYPLGVYVCRDFRRQGIGSSIIEELIKFYGAKLIATPWDEGGKSLYFKKNIRVKNERNNG